MSKSNLFKWRHYEPEIILLCVRWYLTYPLSYRQVAEMVRRVRSCRFASESNSPVNERGLDVHHTTVFRWVQRYGPEIDKRCRPHLRSTNDSWRVDETYIEVKGKPKYLYRAVDSAGQTIDFLLAAKRDAKAAKRFFRKVLTALHTGSPRVITVDRNAAYPKAIDELKAKSELPKSVKLRQKRKAAVIILLGFTQQTADFSRQKYLNNIVEQDHRGIKRLVKPGMGFKSFHTARRTIKGYKIVHMLKKWQIEKVEPVRCGGFQGNFATGNLPVAKLPLCCRNWRRGRSRC